MNDFSETFRSFDNISNFSSRRRDRFGPKIVEIRDIFAISRPFEDFQQFSDFCSILACLGEPTWGHVRHFWLLRSAKFGLKRILQGYQHEKPKNSRNTTPANTGATFGRPRWRPKCLKIGPRRLQEAFDEQF